MYLEIIKKIKPEMDKAVQFLEREIAKIRTGRATPSLVEDIVADCFGQKFPIKQLAAISTPEPKTVVIQPWDKSALVNIEAGIRDSNLNLNPVNDGKVVRLTLPTLTEDRRKELNKIVQQAAENTRIVLRNERRKTWEEIQNLVKVGKATEDDKYQSEEDLNKAINEFNDKIEKILKDKEKEIMGQ